MHIGLPVPGLAWCLQQMYRIGLYVTCCAYANTRAVMLQGVVCCTALSRVSRQKQMTAELV